MYKKKESIKFFWEFAVSNEDDCFEDYFTYDPLQARIIDKAPEILEMVLTKYCSSKGKKIIERTFGLIDGVPLTINQLYDEPEFEFFNIKEEFFSIEEEYDNCIETLYCTLGLLKEFLFKEDCESHFDFSSKLNKKVIRKLIETVGVIKFVEICIEKKEDTISFEYEDKKQVVEKGLLKKILAQNIMGLDLDVRTYNKLMFHAVTVLDLVNLINTKELKNIEGIGKKTYKEIVDKISRVIPNFQDYDFRKVTIESFDIKNGIYDKVLNDIEIEVMFKIEGDNEKLKFFKDNNIFTIGQLIDAYNAEFPFIKDEKQKIQIKHFTMMRLRRFMKFNFNFV